MCDTTKAPPKSPSTTIALDAPSATRVQSFLCCFPCKRVLTCSDAPNKGEMPSQSCLPPGRRLPSQLVSGIPILTRLRGVAKRRGSAFRTEQANEYYLQQSSAHRATCFGHQYAVRALAPRIKFYRVSFMDNSKTAQMSYCLQRGSAVSRRSRTHRAPRDPAAFFDVTV